MAITDARAKYHIAGSRSLVLEGRNQLVEGKSVIRKWSFCFSYTPSGTLSNTTLILLPESRRSRVLISSPAACLVQVRGRISNPTMQRFLGLCARPLWSRQPVGSVAGCVPRMQVHRLGSFPEGHRLHSGLWEAGGPPEAVGTPPAASLSSNPTICVRRAACVLNSPCHTGRDWTTANRFLRRRKGDSSQRYEIELKAIVSSRPSAAYPR